MVGFDCEGRVKVWLNSNFSKHYLYGPHYLEPQTSPFEEKYGNEKQMVAEIIDMAITKTTKAQQEASIIRDFMGKRNSGHTFASAKEDLRFYSTRSGHVLPCNLHSPLSKIIKVDKIIMAVLVLLVLLFLFQSPPETTATPLNSSNEVKDTTLSGTDQAPTLQNTGSKN